MKKTYLFLLIVCLIFMAACSTSFLSPQKETVPEGSTLTSTVPIPRPTNTLVSTPTLPPVETAAAVQPTQSRFPIPEQIRRLWPVEASSDLMYFDMEMVTGAPGAELCVDPYAEWLSGQHEEDHAAHYMQFTYAYALLPEQINLTFSAKPADDFRVEIMDSASGLSRVVYEGNLHTVDICPINFYIPIQTDIAADTVIVTFEGLHSTLALSAVEMIGVLPGYADLPVFWRVEIPADPLAEPDSQFPGGMAVDAMNRVFVAIGRNGIQQFDVEGNLVKDFSVPSESNVRDVAVDRDGNIVAADIVHQWFITLAPDGLQMNTGGEDFGWNMPSEVAVNPIDGNIYLMDETEERSQIRVYDSVTAQWQKDLLLETTGSGAHRGLAFDAQGFLYTINQNEAGIQKLNPENGEIVDTLGYLDLNTMSPYDLAIDGAGNIYVLMSTNPDGSAVVVLDRQGNLIRRFGALTYDGAGWGEGTFLFPVSIAVTADGRFVFVCENGFLTAYLLEQ